jgi:hypothetical protein
VQNQTMESIQRGGAEKEESGEMNRAPRELSPANHVRFVAFRVFASSGNAPFLENCIYAELRRTMVFIVGWGLCQRLAGKKQELPLTTMPPHNNCCRVIISCCSALSEPRF